MASKDYVMYAFSTDSALCNILIVCFKWKIIETFHVLCLLDNDAWVDQGRYKLFVLIATYAICLANIFKTISSIYLLEVDLWNDKRAHIETRSTFMHIYLCIHKHMHVHWAIRLSVPFRHWYILSNPVCKTNLYRYDVALNTAHMRITKIQCVLNHSMEVIKKII